MRAFRRAIVAVLGTAVFAALVRLKGRGGVAPTVGGWRELTPEELERAVGS